MDNPVEINFNIMFNISQTYNSNMIIIIVNYKWLINLGTIKEMFRNFKTLATTWLLSKSNNIPTFADFWWE